jgi:hypothetical protein
MLARKNFIVLFLSGEISKNAIAARNRRVKNKGIGHLNSDPCIKSLQRFLLATCKKSLPFLLSKFYL